jgi:hypothetical protein
LELLRCQRLQLERRLKISRSRSWRSAFLLVRARYYLIELQGAGTELEFETWLKNRIELAEFGCLTVEEIKRAALADLALDQQTLNRYLVRVTGRRRRFRSDGVIVTMRT